MLRYKRLSVDDVAVAHSPKQIIKQTSVGREVDIAFPRRGSFTHWYTISDASHSFSGKR